MNRHGAVAVQSLPLMDGLAEFTLAEDAAGLFVNPAVCCSRVLLRFIGNSGKRGLIAPQPFDLVITRSRNAELFLDEPFHVALVAIVISDRDVALVETKEFLPGCNTCEVATTEDSDSVADSLTDVHLVVNIRGDFHVCVKVCAHNRKLIT